MEDRLEVQVRSSTAGLTWKYLPLSLDLQTYTVDFRTRLLARVRPDWDPTKLKYTVFDEGITNTLIGFYEEGRKKEDVVLLRLNGNGTENVIDRASEVSTMIALHQAGMSPPLYYELKNGLCYGFVQGRFLSVDEMAEEGTMKKVARQLARLHAVPVPSSMQKRQPHIWEKLEKWIEIVPREFDEPEKNEM